MAFHESHEKDHATLAKDAVSLKEAEDKVK